MKPTVNNPIEGMIESTGRYTKTVGGKRYLVYFETIASQVKMADGRTAEERLSQVDEYFRLANEYVAGLAEDARNSKDAAHASELAAAASHVAAAQEAQKAAVSARDAATDAGKVHVDRLYVEGVAADVEAAVRDVAIEILAPEIIDTTVNRVVPKVAEILCPYVVEEMHGLVSDELEMVNVRLDDVNDRLTELTLSTAVRDENLELAVMRNVQKIDANYEELNGYIKFVEHRLDSRVNGVLDAIDRLDDELNERIVDVHDELDSKIIELTLSTAIRDENLTLASQRHTQKMAELEDKVNTRCDALNDRISENQIAQGYEITQLAATDSLQTAHLAELETRFDDKQLADTERFSNLSYASVVHTREILELTERETAGVITNFLTMSRMVLCHMKEIMWNAKAYLASLSTSAEIAQLVTGDGTEIDSHDITFVSTDGQRWSLADLTINHRYEV